jgi:pSer/pThr/pTyr-binding forkhead associated (FHA) protein
MGERFSRTGEFGEEVRTQISVRLKGFRPRPTRAHILTQTEGPGGALRFVLEDDQVTIGRSASSDIVLDNDNVSRAHARLSRIDDEYTIEDLDSRNGILLNGLAVHAAVLRDGDEVHVGDFVFTYHEGS